MSNRGPPKIRVRFVVYEITQTHPDIQQRRLRAFATQEQAEQYGRGYAARRSVPVTVERRVYVDGKLKSSQPDIAVF
jgi:hypothetical protein